MNLMRSLLRQLTPEKLTIFAKAPSSTFGRVLNTLLIGGELRSPSADENFCNDLYRLKSKEIIRINCSGDFLELSENRITSKWQLRQF